jgi:hypothetical protein
MRRPPLLTQIVAVFSRRTLAFQPSPGQPPTFGGALHRVLHSHPGPALREAAGSTGRGGHHAANVVVAGVPNLVQFADEFASRPAHERLSARAWLESPLMDLAYQLFHIRAVATDLADNLVRDPVSDRDRADTRILVSTIDIALDHALDVIRAVTHVLARDHNNPRDVAREVARAYDYAHDLARALALAHDHGRALARAFALDPVLARARDLARDLARNSVIDLDDAFSNPHAYNLAGLIFSALGNDIQILRDETGAKWQAAAEAMTRLRSAAGDMVGADLRATDLKDVPLAGVRWSTSTHWPEALRDWIGTHSEQIGPDLYQIQDRYDSNDRTAILTG